MPTPTNPWDETSTPLQCWLSLHLLSPPPPPPSLPPPTDTPTSPTYTHPPTLDIAPAPLLPPNSTLHEHPSLVWAEDTEWDTHTDTQAQEIVATKHGPCLPPHKVRRYEALAGRYWDVFYRRNTTNFFKDRHYLQKDFPDLVCGGVGGNEGGGGEEEEEEGEGEGEEGSATAASTTSKDSPSFSSSSPSPSISNQQQQQQQENVDETLAYPQPHHRVLIEMGCGVGNAVFPLLESDPNLFIYALDFSPRAISLLKQHPLYVCEGQEGKGEGQGKTHTHTHTQRKRCQAYVCDVVNEPLPLQVRNADLCLLMYSLSAMDPETLPGVVEKIYKALKPGGRVLLRDYGRWDEAQLRFKKGHRLKDNFYLRSDGTRAYYFTLEDVRRLFVEQGGMVEVELGYIRRQYINRGDGVTRRRVWVHGRFEKGKGGEEEGEG